MAEVPPAPEEAWLDQLRFLAKVGATREAGMRLGLWVEALASLEPEAGAALLERAGRGAPKTPEGLVAYLPLLAYPELLARVGGQRLAGLLEAARRLELAAALLLLENPDAWSAPEEEDAPERENGAVRREPEIPPDPFLETLTLGFRRTAARGVRSHLLSRILKDPDPRVVSETLQNPRLREEEVIAIASRRPCPESVFWDLAGSPGWAARLPVRRAMALNHFAPPRLARALLPTLPQPALKDVAQMKRLHPRARDGALMILSWS